jgi:hypothetical protein
MRGGARNGVPAILSPILHTLKPSFLGRHAPAAKPRRLHPTSYLDGLRGVAALFVVFAHYEATYFPFLNPAWHASDDNTGGVPSRNNHVLQFPILRTIYSSRFMVAIFFVISGHVLSQKAIGGSAEALIMRCQQFFSLESITGNLNTENTS